MLDGRWRAKAQHSLDPIGRGLHAIGVSADGLTLMGLVAAAGTAVLIANGNLLLGLIGLILAGLPDLLDGSVARFSGTESKRGAFFDSVCDRVADALLLGGVAWNLNTNGSNDAILVLAVLALTMLVSYERAKAEALGFDARGGVMERLERLVLLGVGLALDVLVPVMWIMLVLTAITAVHRFAMVWRQATPPPDGAGAAGGPRRRLPRRQRVRRSRPHRLSRVPGRR